MYKYFILCFAGSGTSMGLCLLNYHLTQLISWTQVNAFVNVFVIRIALSLEMDITQRLQKEYHFSYFRQPLNVMDIFACSDTIGVHSAMVLILAVHNGLCTLLRQGVMVVQLVSDFVISDLSNRFGIRQQILRSYPYNFVWVHKNSKVQCRIFTYVYVFQTSIFSSYQISIVKSYVFVSFIPK